MQCSRLLRYGQAKSLGITASKVGDLSQWYIQSLLRSELLDYSEVSGCHILRPWGYSIWAHLQSFLQREFTLRGVQDCYFPLLIPESSLRLEQSHIEGFSPEVAWVTHAGASPLNVRLAVRPTSETAIYPAYSRWIRTWRDLPLRLNQWCSVVRWEFHNPQPLLRAREFLWQEGHSAFTRKEDADAEVRDILGVYRRAFEELLAIPVTEGIKSERERFAGALYSTSVETFIPEAGRAIQGATSHGLGQNFSRMFGVQYEDDHGRRQFAWQNSWGFSTRSIGIMVMLHGDDRGLVLPPKVAPQQVIIIPVGITSRSDPNEVALITSECHRLSGELREAGIRTIVDATEHQTPGWKFNHWEVKGVPLRVEIGPKELMTDTVTTCKRVDGNRSTLHRANVISEITTQLDLIQEMMLIKARQRYIERIVPCMTWDSMVEIIDGGKMALLPWCERSECEGTIKDRTSTSVNGEPVSGAKSLCIPFEQPFEALPKSTCCPACNHPARRWTLFARSY